MGSTSTGGASSCLAPGGFGGVVPSVVSAGGSDVVLCGAPDETDLNRMAMQVLAERMAGISVSFSLDHGAKGGGGGGGNLSHGEDAVEKPEPAPFTPVLVNDIFPAPIAPAHPRPTAAPFFPECNLLWSAMGGSGWRCQELR